MTQERIDHIAQQLGMRLRLSQAAGGSQVHLSLRPRELGDVTVQLSVRNGEVAATVLVDRADTGKLLNQNLDDLRRSLQDQGLNVQQFSVDVRDGGANSAFAHGAAEGNNGGSRGSANATTTVGGDDALDGFGEAAASPRPEDVHDGHVSVLA